jgi:hypothetical protein
MQVMNVTGELIAPAACATIALHPRRFSRREESAMEEVLEFEEGCVPCARCGLAVCGLSVIPQIEGECSTMEGTQAGSVLDLTPTAPSNNLFELACDRFAA